MSLVQFILQEQNEEVADTYHNHFNSLLKIPGNPL